MRLDGLLAFRIEAGEPAAFRGHGEHQRGGAGQRIERVRLEGSFFLRQRVSDLLLEAVVEGLDVGIDQPPHPAVSALALLDEQPEQLGMSGGEANVSPDRLSCLLGPVVLALGPQARQGRS